MDADYEIDKRIGLLLAQAQEASTATFEMAAMILGCSSNTLRNWIKGKSGPKPSEFFAYCNAIGVDAFDLLIKAVYNNSGDRADARRTELHALIDALEPEDQERLLYLMKPRHGSDPKAMLQQMVAQSQLPMVDRVLASRSVETSYLIAERQGTLVGQDAPQPDMEYLRLCIRYGFDAAAKGRNAYFQFNQLAQEEQ